ncbi:MAG: UPF0104 family protein [Chloroflexi bacterium]|nr:MAG: UPF0104 family protein [Chloroflexota bacterium]
MLVAVAGFFVYRFFQQGSSAYYLTGAVIFAAAGLLGLIGVLAAKWQNVVLNLGISLFFLDFVFAEIEWDKFAQALLEANYWWMIPSTLAIFVHLYFRTLRWQWLLKPIGDVTFWPAFRALVIGITGNVVLPARAGEFIRAYVIGRSTGVSKTGAFATLVVERIFDGLTVLLVLLGVIIFGVRNADLQRAGILGAVFYLGALAALFVFMSKRHWADWLIHKLLPQKLADTALGVLDGFTSGLAVLKSPKNLGMVLLWNVFTWVAIPVSFYFALLAFDFGSPVPWMAAILMLPAMALALTIPGAPAGVGLVQFAVKLTLDTSFAGLPLAADFGEKVAAASILIHISQFAPEVVAGVVSFMVEGLSTSDIKAGQQFTPEEQPAG